MGIKRWLLALGIALALIVTMSSVAFAFLAAPTSVTVENRKLFRNLAETGDMLVVFHYRIAYTTYPDTPASNSIIFKLYDTDGATILSQAQPYNFSPFDTNGYGDGVASFYFEPQDAPGWGSGYFINILMTPAYYSPSSSH